MIERLLRGHIIIITLDPTLGKEQKATRPAIVLTTQLFNRMGTALIAPITSGGDFARSRGFTVLLSETKTTGHVLTNQIRTIDINERVSKIVEMCPSYIVDEVLAKVQTLIDN